MQKFQVALKAFVVEGGRLLMMRESDGEQFWELPGGRIDVGEEDRPLHDVLRRELSEELGPAFAVEIGERVAAWVRPPDARRPTSVFLLGYRCRRLSGEIAISSEHVEYRWVTQAESAALPLAPGYAEPLKQFWLRPERATATVGLIGGLGPESTIDYYRRIIQVWQRHEPSSSPSIVIDSLDVQRGLQLVANDVPGLTEYLFASVRRLAGAGVDFVAMTANTGHIVFDELAARSPVPMLSIVEVCVEEAKRRGLKRLGLLGTRFTMEAAFYPTVFARHGIEIVPPPEAERLAVHQRYVGELLKGDFRDETREEIVGLIKRLRDEERIDGIILGGTELPLLLKAPEIAGLPALDTTALHVDAIVKRLLTPAAETPGVPSARA